MANFILNHFRNEKIIRNDSIKISNNLEFYDSDFQHSIDVSMINFNKPFAVKTDIRLGLQTKQVSFKVKLIHSSDLDILEQSIKKIQSYNEIKVYVKKKNNLDLRSANNVPLKCLYKSNELNENIDIINIVHNLDFDYSFYVNNTNFFDKTNGDKLEKLQINSKAVAKGIFKIGDGQLPFEFDVEIIVDDLVRDINSKVIMLESSLNDENGLVYVFDYINTKKFPNLSKTFLSQMIQAIYVKTIRVDPKRYILENFKFYIRNQTNNKLEEISNDNQIKYGESIFVESKLTDVKNNSVYRSFIAEIPLPEKSI